ncbi:MAG: KUP/HAK/KT family potassium transporter [Bacteroidetes bacterium]|nr:KUP/HAK/KT family potassium transporter [Bacteroidota bacterium]
MKSNHLTRLSAAGVLVTLGIVFGDIGTSPIYVFSEICGHEKVSETLVLGALSCILWTLTFQTTLKYVLLTLRADNKGEGGILSLYALTRRHAKWLVVPAIIGGSALLADGIITPPISVISAVEGLTILNPDVAVVPIGIIIIIALFIFQRFGTKIVGNFFGPMMLLWFVTLAVLGVNQIVENPSVFKAINPYYAYDFLVNYPGGFWLLGAVFLCTTGAEALYSDLGHCGRRNIQVSWIFVKISLLLNYFGQAAWLTKHIGINLTLLYPNNPNPFYLIMPDWFILPGIIIATSAAVIASQALISGSYTLISEAIRLNLWPKISVLFPTNERGQVYIPSINWILCAGCIFIVLLFQKSSNMGAAYGLAITVTMLMTTILLTVYLLSVKKNAKWLVLSGLVLFATIELSFLVANLVKLPHGGYVTLIVGGVLVFIMWAWYKARKIKNRYIEFAKIEKYLPMLKELSEDTTITKYATNLVYLTSADVQSDIETKIVYSIFNKQPKRADIYWFVHVNVLDEPYTMEYRVRVLVPEKVFKVEFMLGFRVPTRINLYFRKVVEDLSKNREVDVISRYDSLKKHDVVGDFRFIVIDRILNYDFKLNTYEQFLMSTYSILKSLSLSEERAFGLDTSAVTTETVPLITIPTGDVKLTRLVPYTNGALHHIEEKEGV